MPIPTSAASFSISKPIPTVRASPDCSLPPFGRTGLYRHYKGSDAIANATGGFLFGQGDNTKGQCTAPSHLAYQMAGAMAGMLALAGIRHARETGAGQRIDVSLQEALTFTNSSSIARY